MELIIGAAAVLGLLFLLGVSVGTIAAIVQVIMSVLTFLMLLFFLFCVFVLLRSKKFDAQFAGLEVKHKDKPSENGQDQKELNKGMKFARYIVDGEKLTNWFPAEGILTGKIYSQEKCTVRIASLGRKKLVFDRHSTTIVVWGTVLMSLATVFLSVYSVYFIKNM